MMSEPLKEGTTTGQGARRLVDALALSGSGLVLGEKQLGQFRRYFELLVQWNEKMNLTGITEETQVYVKHFYDSLSVSFYTDMQAVSKMADIGSGAGFPSIPLKIAFPHLQVTIVDSLNKRVQFLQHVGEEIGLGDVTYVHGRAEDLARQSVHRDAYDLVTARAVARLTVLNELCLPFVRVGGLFVAMKGTDPSEELTEATFSLAQLKAMYTHSYSFRLPDEEQSQRTLLHLRKQAVTPKPYPRKAGLPLKQPLIKP